MDRQKNELEASNVYIDHFGDLPQQSAIVSIEAYTPSGPSLDIARAWLLNDGAGLERLTWNEIVGEEKAAEILKSALAFVAQELWNSKEISQKYHPRIAQAVNHLHSVQDTA